MIDPLIDRLVDELAALRARVAALEQAEFTLQTGTWTPAFAGTTIAGTFTYTNQLGWYWQIGKLVYIQANLLISAISVAPTGNMRITGLPFTSENTSNKNGSVFFGAISNVKYTAASLGITGFVLTNNTIIALDEIFTDAVTVAYPAANFTNAAAQMIFSGFYPIA